MASAFKWRLTDTLFSYLTDVSGNTPQINSGYPASVEEVISKWTVTKYAAEQDYAEQFDAMKQLIWDNPDTSAVTLLNYSYYYDMNENSCGFIGGGAIRGQKGDKGDKGDTGDKGNDGKNGNGIKRIDFQDVTSNGTKVGTRVIFYLDSGTPRNFIVRDGTNGTSPQIDYEYLKTLIDSAITVEINNISGYIGNYVYEYVSGDVRDLNIQVQNISSYTNTLVHQVGSATTDINKLQRSYSSLTSEITYVCGRTENATRIAQTANDTSITATRKADSALTDCAKLSVAYSGITMKVDSFSGDVVTYSQIEVVATAITANVYDGLKRTGIDIQSGTIDISADTTNFHGSIKLYDADEGLMLFNSNNEVAVDIKNTSIGSFGALQNTTVDYTSRSFAYTYVIGSAVGSPYYRAYISAYDTTNAWVSELQQNSNPMTFRLGRASNGNVLNFNNITYTITGDTNSAWNQNIHDYSVKFQLHWLNSENTVFDTGWIEPTRNSYTGKFSIPNQTYTVGLAGSGYEWTVLMYFKGPNGLINNTQNKYISFEGGFTMSKTVSINTKIGTDGMYSVNPNGEFWCSEDNIGMYFNNVNYNLYGNGKNSFGWTTTAYGLNKAIGTSYTALDNWDRVETVLHISGTTNDSDANRMLGTVGWTTWNYNSDTHTEDGKFEYMETNGLTQHCKVHPSILLVEGLHPSWSSRNHYIMLNPYSASVARPPIGLVVTIINCTTSNKVYAVGYNASGPTPHGESPGLPKCMYDDDTNDLYRGIPIGAGKTVSFIYLGGGDDARSGRWKPLQMYGGGSFSPTDF